MKKFIFIIIILALFGLLGWKVYQKVSASSEGPGIMPGPPPVAIEAKRVRKATVRDISLFTGTLYPRSQYIVAPKVGGRLEKLLVNIGDRVRRGQLIALLEDEEYQRQVDQAKAELEVAEAKIEESRSSLDIANRELERLSTLRRSNITSQSSLDTAEAQVKAQNAMYKSAQAQFAQKEAALKAAQVRLSYTSINASWEEGDEYRVVGERFVDEGTMLAPNSSIVSILDNSVLKAVINVIERDYPKLKKGQEAVVSTDAWPGKSFIGRIVRIAPLLKENSRQARVEVEVPNQENLLKPGMFARIRIEFARHEDVTVVPTAALVKRNGIEGIFTVDPGERKARFIPLTLGIVNDELAEVVNPPISGMVVTLGQHLLGDGSPVILPGAGKGGPPAANGAPARPTQEARP